MSVQTVSGFDPSNRFVTNRDREIYQTVLKEAFASSKWPLVVEILKQDIKILDGVDLRNRQHGHPTDIFTALLRGVILTWNADADQVFKQLLEHTRMDCDFSGWGAEIVLCSEIGSKDKRHRLVFMAREIALLQTKYVVQIPSRKLEEIKEMFTGRHKDLLIPAIGHGIAQRLITLPEEISSQFVIDRLTDLIKQNKEREQAARERSLQQEKAARARAKQQQIQCIVQ